MYIVITATTYPERLAFPMINELLRTFKEAHGDRSLHCAEQALSKKCAAQFKALCDDYEDPTRKDKVAAVAAQFVRARVPVLVRVVIPARPCRPRVG